MKLTKRKPLQVILDSKSLRQITPQNETWSENSNNGREEILLVSSIKNFTGQMLLRRQYYRDNIIGIISALP